MDDALLTDTEAEAALLALGGTLEWKDHSEVAFTSEHFRARTDERVYNVWSNTVDSKDPAMLAELPYTAAASGEPERMAFQTVAEAKAACEIHAATGQFPPGVEPELSSAEQSPEEGQNQ